MVVEWLRDPLAQFVVLVALAIVLRVVGGRSLSFRLVANAAFFLALTALLLLHGTAPYMQGSDTAAFSQRVSTGVMKAVWWIGGAMMLVNIVRVFLILERKPREARLLQDLVIGLIYLGTGLSIIAYVFSVPVGTLIATSGVFAIVLGLALQSTLSDVFSGVALKLGHPYDVGDWVSLEDGLDGRVIETNWRSTYILTGSNDLAVVPNSALAKARLVNLSRPDETHGISLIIRVQPTHPPAHISSVLENVLLGANRILRVPSPSVLVTGLDNQAIVLELACRVKKVGDAGSAKNEIYDLVYRHAKAAGLQLAGMEGAAAPPAMSNANGEPTETAWRLLDAIPLFATLTEQEKETLSKSMKRKTFHADNLICGQKQKLTSLFLVRAGVVVVEHEKDGAKKEITRLSPGDCLGERGVLMNAEEEDAIRALTYVVLYEIPQANLSNLLQDRPALAEELGVILSRRMLLARGRTADQSEGHHAISLASRIRQLFHVPQPS
jgi:small-conductance mechanosensitive channel/CRP-like cAMP-binding protein